MLLVAGAMLVGGWLAWSIVANTAADTLSTSDPEAALRWRPSHAEALVQVAESRLADLRSGDSEGAETVQQLAATALRSNALAAGALRATALAAEIGNDEGTTRAVMDVLATRTRRDPSSEIWLFNNRVEAGEYGAAVDHADAVLRVRRDLYGTFAEPLLAIAENGEGREALLQALRRSPPWRTWFLETLARDRSSKPGLVFAFYSALKDSPEPPSLVDLRSFLNGLVSTGQYERAYLVWLHFLERVPGEPVEYAYNGDFEKPILGLAYDWTISNGRGATTKILELAPDQHVLSVEFGNTRVRYNNVRKLLFLPPGAYRLSGDARSDNLVNERGLIWRVSCAEARGGQALGATEALRGTRDWHAFGVDFSVPQTGCRAQWLQLVLPSRTALEELASGLAFYDNLRVERIPDDNRS